MSQVFHPRQKRAKNHWTAAKRRMARIVDANRGALADALLHVLGHQEPEGDQQGAMWYIPDRLEIDIAYIQPADQTAIADFEAAIQNAIDEFLNKDVAFGDGSVFDEPPERPDQLSGGIQ